MNTWSNGGNVSICIANSSAAMTVGSWTKIKGTLLLGIQSTPSKTVFVGVGLEN